MNELKTFKSRRQAITDNCSLASFPLTPGSLDIFDVYYNYDGIEDGELCIQLIEAEGSTIDLSEYFDDSVIERFYEKLEKTIKEI